MPDKHVLSPGVLYIFFDKKPHFPEMLLYGKKKNNLKINHLNDNYKILSFFIFGLQTFDSYL